jgi:uncharacterized membrane protein YeaQ/YmgE (transglycosylase-associated protein family)
MTLATRPRQTQIALVAAAAPAGTVCNGWCATATVTAFHDRGLASFGEQADSASVRPYDQPVCEACSNTCAESSYIPRGLVPIEQAWVHKGRTEIRKLGSRHENHTGDWKMNLIIWLVVGGVIGWLAILVMKTDAQQGIALNVVVGIVGALLGGWLLSPLVGAGTLNQGDFSLMGLLVSFGGAVILLLVVNLVRRGTAR